MNEGDIFIVKKGVDVKALNGGNTVTLNPGARCEVITIYHDRGEAKGARMQNGELQFNFDFGDGFLQCCKCELPQLPVGSFLMLRPKVEEEKSKGGIYIPEQARNNAHQGVILKLGGDVPSEFQKGDEVVYTKHTDYKLTIDEAFPIVLVNYNDVILRTPAEYVEADQSTTTAPETP